MKKYLKFAPWAMIGLMVLALFMLFAPQVRTEAGNSWDGIGIIFGSTLYEEEVLKFSFLNMLTYILTFASIVFTLLYCWKENRKFLIASVICSFLAALFFFLAKTFVVPTEEIKELIQQYCSLDVGAVLGGIFSLLASGLGFIKLASDK